MPENHVLSTVLIWMPLLFSACREPSSITEPPQALVGDVDKRDLTGEIATNGDDTTGAPVIIRVATYNASLHRKNAGELVKDLSQQDNQQAKQVAEIVQRVRPDILLINEIDYQADKLPATLLRDNYFSVGQNSLEPIVFPYIYAPPSNTGIPSGMDLNNDGKTDGPGDCFGFGQYPGQYAFAVFSRFPIGKGVRSFQKFLWSDMPSATNPAVPGSESAYYPVDVWRRLRLSSKNHCDVPVLLTGKRTLHFLVCHPTPPVFDSTEDRNGARNSTEIRFWTDYISDREANNYLYDDQGMPGGLHGEDTPFIIAGDLNSDPEDGDSRHEAIQALIQHPRVRDPRPQSKGGLAVSATGQRNLNQRGDPNTDTSQWSSGNLRVDYVLPSNQFHIRDAGVFWPSVKDPNHELIQASDHRLVWVDVEL